ncbi:glycosyltransferase family 4 protein [Luteibaculum oceani]|uniref:Glycosyltransferase family 4 protein n=1 Tax=Luteibaculum oceani TaxID=1294296 RepID=A0A5C6V7Y5_9FLAO|nr:glycosyltransferase family 4 protein [Luteibaculum oceani]TXC81402.1 glycosyltransferase family 4 protein [Luteibaculum oceani]
MSKINSRNRHILFIEGSNLGYGSEKSLSDLILSLDRSEFQAKIFYLLQTKYTKYPIVSKFLQAFNLVRLSLVLTLGNVDLVCVNQAGAHKYWSFLRRFMDRDTLIFLRILEDIEYCNDRRIWQSFRNKTKFLTNSYWMYKEALNTGGIYNEEIIFWKYDYVNVNLNVDIIPACKLSGKVVFIGRLTKVKGVDLLINWIKNSRFDLEVHVYGDGEYHFKEVLTELNEEYSFINYHGYVPNVEKNISAGDILIVPSRIEPMGRIIMEAWSSNAIPLVYELSGGAFELVRDAGAGIAFSDFSSDGIDNAIDYLKSLPEKDLWQLQSNGKAWLVRNNSLKAYSNWFQTCLKVN